MISLYIIYHDVSGTHSAVVAAAIHLNYLPIDTVPTKYDILNLPLFDRLEKKDLGRLIYHGNDEYKNSIYTLGRQHTSHLVVNTINTIFNMIDQDEKEILCVDTSKTVNNFIRIGGTSSRKLNFVSFGRPIVTYGIIKSYPKICEIVKKTKLKIVP